jgi:hypothetical protein
VTAFEEARDLSEDLFSLAGDLARHHAQRLAMLSW